MSLNFSMKKLIKRNSPIKFVIPLLLFMVLSACAFQPEQREFKEWLPSEVRLLDPVDSKYDSLDLIALYTRAYQDEIQVRLDYLDLEINQNHDLYLALDFKPGGSIFFPPGDTANAQWDMVIYSSSSGEITTYEPNQQAEWEKSRSLPVIVNRNPVLDTVEVFVSSSKFIHKIPQAKIQAWITLPGSSETIDKIDPTLLNARAPSRLPVLFAFSGTFPAYTPAQATRRWDGAHTGPSGGRHGLANLLRTAANADIHLLLLDLAEPNSLSVLNYLDVLPQLRSGLEAGEISSASPLLISDAETPKWIDDHILDENFIATTEYDLPVSNIIYQAVMGQSDGLQNSEYGIENKIQYVNGYSLIKVPFSFSPETNPQASLDGLTLQYRKLITQMAYDNMLPSHEKVLVLGGYLPQSTWGIPGAARAAFRYLNAHPWIKVIDQNSLHPGLSLVFPETTKGGNSGADLLPTWLLNDLYHAPDNVLTDAAWSTFRALFSPLYPLHPDLPKLREQYVGEVGILLQAAKWVEESKPISDCSQDPDHDGAPECILATENIFTVYEIETAALADLFVICGRKVHQVIGPTSQLITGLSDPIEWDLDAGDFSDPSVINGAFSGPFGPYQVEIKENGIIFTSANGLSRKEFKINSKGITVEIHFEKDKYLSEGQKIPILLDPWYRFTLDGLNLYQTNIQPNQFSWDIFGIALVDIKTQQNYMAISFNESHASMSKVENPNFEYPPGHYLPFPIAVVALSADSGFEVSIDLNCDQDENASK